MADQDITELTEIPARAHHLFYVGDLHESTVANQNRSTSLSAIADAMIVYNGEIVTINGNVVVRG